MCFSAVFTWSNLLVAVVELNSSENEAADVIPLVTSAVLEEQYQIVGVVVVVDPGVVPINSRGEKQRMHLRDGFLNDHLDPVFVAYNMWWPISSVYFWVPWFTVFISVEKSHGHSAVEVYTSSTWISSVNISCSHKCSSIVSSVYRHGILFAAWNVPCHSWWRLNAFVGEVKRLCSACSYDISELYQEPGTRTQFQNLLPDSKSG